MLADERNKRIRQLTAELGRLLAERLVEAVGVGLMPMDPDNAYEGLAHYAHDMTGPEIVHAGLAHLRQTNRLTE